MMSFLLQDKLFSELMGIANVEILRNDDLRLGLRIVNI